MEISKRELSGKEKSEIINIIKDQSRHSEFGGYLLKLGDVNLNCSDFEGNTLLNIAIGHGNNETIVKTLIEKEANPNFQNENDGKDSPLHLAIKKFNHYVNKNSQVSVTTNDLQNNPELLYCCNVLGILLNNGASPNVTDKEGNTPLHIANFKQDDKKEPLFSTVVNAFIEKEVDLKQKNNKEQTALEGASKYLMENIGEVQMNKKIKKILLNDENPPLIDNFNNILDIYNKKNFPINSQQKLSQINSKNENESKELPFVTLEDYKGGTGGKALEGLEENIRIYGAEPESINKKTDKSFFHGLSSLNEVYILLNARIKYIQENEPEENQSKLIKNVYDQVDNFAKEKGRPITIGDWLTKYQEKTTDLPRLNLLMESGWLYRQNIQDENGNTAMHLITQYAAENGDLEPFKILFNQQANDQPQNHRDWSIKNNKGVSAADLVREYSEGLKAFVAEEEFKEISESSKRYLVVQQKKEFMSKAIESFGTEKEKGPDTPRTTIRDKISGKPIASHTLGKQQL